MNQNHHTINQLNEIADKIEMYLEGDRDDPEFVELDDDDHDNFTTAIRYAGEDWCAMENDEDYNMAYWRARRWLKRWNDEEYPSAEDIMSDMFPEGVDDGYDFYDED